MEGEERRKEEGVCVFFFFLGLVWFMDTSGHWTHVCEMEACGWDGGLGD